MEALSTQLKFINCELHCRVIWLRHLVWEILGLSFWARYPEKTLPFFFCLKEKGLTASVLRVQWREMAGNLSIQYTYNDESYSFHCTSTLNCTQTSIQRSSILNSSKVNFQSFARVREGHISRCAAWESISQLLIGLLEKS